MLVKKPEITYILHYLLYNLNIVILENLEKFKKNLLIQLFRTKMIEFAYYFFTLVAYNDVTYLHT
jgi:hypothetical protein